MCYNIYRRIDIVKFNIRGNKMDITPAIKSYIEEKIGRLDKYLENPNEITTTVYMIEKYGGDNKDYYYTRLLNQHNTNIEFEAINGFEYNVNTKLDKKSSIKAKNKTKQTSITFSADSIDKTKKETAAERKLKAHIAKINSFKINIKPVNNANNTL